MTTGMLFVMNFWKGRRKDKDSPTPPIVDEQKQYLEENCLKQRVIEADFIKLVQLPSSLDCNEWLATHTISFFNHVNLMYGVVSEYCTCETCASMVGPDNVQYHWQDEKGKKLKQSAPQYIDHMMSYVQKSVTDESIFPTKFGQEFPTGFPDIVRKIHRYLFHVLAHVYHSHFAQMLQLGLQGHLNSLFCHFMVFSAHHHLLQEKEAEVLSDLHKGLLKAMQDPNQNSQTAAPHPDDEGGDDNHAATARDGDGDGDDSTSRAATRSGGGVSSSSSSPTSSALPSSSSFPSSAQTGAADSLEVDKKSRSGSENGMAVRAGGKTLVDIPST